MIDTQPYTTGKVEIIHFYCEYAPPRRNVQGLINENIQYILTKGICVQKCH